MKIHGKVEGDGKRRIDVYVDPDGTYILASRISGGLKEKLDQMPEYRIERHEIDQNGRLVDDVPTASEDHQRMRDERLYRDKNRRRSKPASKK